MYRLNIETQTRLKTMFLSLRRCLSLTIQKAISLHFGLCPRQLTYVIKLLTLIQLSSLYQHLRLLRAGAYHPQLKWKAFQQHRHIRCLIGMMALLSNGHSKTFPNTP